MATTAELLRLAVQYHQGGQLPQAEQLYLQILQADPRQGDALHLLGVIACQTGKPQRGVDLISQALAIAPHNAAFHGNIASAYLQLGQLAQAAAAARQAVRLQPNFADAYRTLGKALAGQNQLADAVASYQEALRLRPDFAAAHNDLGIAFKNQNRLSDAAASYRQALRNQPGLADAHNNLGNVLKLMGQLDEAVACCREAVRLRPDLAAAHNNLGNALSDQGRIDEAIASYRQALHFQPHFPIAHSNLLLCLNYTAKVDPQRVFEEHCRWGSLVEAQAPAPTPHGNDPTPDRVLRVGYVSPDLRNHPVVSFLEPILAAHDPRQVQVYCYAEVSAPDAVSERLRSLVHAWRSTFGQSDAQVAAQVRSDGIDVLVDLAGHTAGNRLPVFTHRPAPVQVTYLGYPNTTGLSTMDYRLTDAVMDPPGAEALNSEALTRLPRGVVCYAAPAQAPAVSALPARTSGTVTFGSLHKLSKLNPAVLDLWCGVLRAVPSSRMLVYRNTLVGKVRDELGEQFRQRGVDAARLDLRHSSPAGHLSVYGEIDIALDTFPYAGGTTSCEALWMGVPFPTLRGDRPAGRAGATLLHAVGLSDLIAESAEGYLSAAVRLANDLDRLAEVRAGLRGRMGATLGDGRAFTRDLEEVYRTLWRAWCSGRPARG